MKTRAEQTRSETWSVKVQRTCERDRTAKDERPWVQRSLPHLLNKKGMAYIKTAVIIIIISMLFSVMLSYASLMSTVSRVRDDTQRTLDSFCIEKAASIYGSVKNGSNQMVSGAYTDLFVRKVATELSLIKSGNTATNRKDNKIVFQVINPLTANLNNDTLSLTADIEVYIPVYFAGLNLTELRVPIKLESVYVLKLY